MSSSANPVPSTSETRERRPSSHESCTSYYPLNLVFLPAAVTMTMIFATFELIYALGSPRQPLLLHAVHMFWCGLIQVGILMSSRSHWKRERTSGITPTGTVEHFEQLLGFAGLCIAAVFSCWSVQKLLNESYDSRPREFAHYLVSVPSVLLNFIAVTYLLAGSRFILIRNKKEHSRPLLVQDAERMADFQCAWEYSQQFWSNIFMSVSLMTAALVHNHSDSYWADPVCTILMSLVFFVAAASATRNSFRKWKDGKNQVDLKVGYSKKKESANISGHVIKH